MTRLVSLAALLALSTGCIFIKEVDRRDGFVDPDPPVFTNFAPEVYDGVALCEYSAADFDDILFVDAVVDDPNGAGDVVQVYADVYDERSGQLVQSFPLYPTNDPGYWFSDWLVSSTVIDCWYPDYTVDLVAYDHSDAYGALTIWFDSYR